MTVYALKLVSGDEIIGTCTTTPANSDSFWVLSRVRQLLISQVGGNNLGVTLMPWLASNQDSEIFIPAIHVITAVIPASHIEENYQSQVSGLDLSASKIQLNG